MITLYHVRFVWPKMATLFSLTLDQSAAHANYKYIKEDACAIFWANSLPSSSKMTSFYQVTAAAETSPGLGDWWRERGCLPSLSSNQYSKPSGISVQYRAEYHSAKWEVDLHTYIDWKLEHPEKRVDFWLDSVKQFAHNCIRVLSSSYISTIKISFSPQCPIVVPRCPVLTGPATFALVHHNEFIFIPGN